MIPDWRTAPRWADYLAMNLDCRWYWFEYEPEYDSKTDTWKATTGLVQPVFPFHVIAENSLQTRPK